MKKYQVSITASLAILGVLYFVIQLGINEKVFFPSNLKSKATIAKSKTFLSKIDTVSFQAEEAEDKVAACNCPTGATILTSGTYTASFYSSICIPLGETVTYAPSGGFGSTMTVTNCGTFTYQGSGGGIGLLLNNYGTATLTNTDFTGMTVNGYDGTIYYNSTGSNTSSTIRMYDGATATFDNLISTSIFIELFPNSSLFLNNSDATCEFVGIYETASFEHNGAFDGTSFTVINKGTADLNLAGFQATGLRIATASTATTTWDNSGVFSATGKRTTSYTTLNSNASSFSIDNDLTNYPYEGCGDSSSLEPTWESCDGIDNNWNGLIDDNCQEICNNNMDDNGDGFIDCADSYCKPTISTVDIVSEPTCANKTNGTITIDATGSGTLSYSITNERNWQTNPTFSNLGIGQYIIRVKNDSGCEIEYSNNPIILDFSPCIEICNNSIDDDGDGLVDCDDPDCKEVGTATAINEN